MRAESYAETKLVLEGTNLPTCFETENSKQVHFDIPRDTYLE